MNIRPATIEDIPQMIDMWMDEALFHESLDPFFQLADKPREKHEVYLQGILTKDNYRVVVAEAENKLLIGFAVVVVSKRAPVFQVQNVASIHDTYVKPEYRKNGVAQNMLNALIDFAKEKGADVVNLSVAVNNEAGSKFWESMGFKPAMKYMSKRLV